MVEKEMTEAQKAIAKALMGYPATTSQYQEIGHFFHEFSQLEFSLRFILGQMLHLPSDYFDIVTTPYDTNALCMVCRALAKKALLPPHADAFIEAVKEVQALNAERNRIAHGTWTDGSAGLSARHVARDSLEPKWHFAKAGDLAALATKAASLQGRIITTYVMAERNKVATNTA